MIETTQTENTKNPTQREQLEYYTKFVEKHIVEAARAFRTAKKVEAKGDDPEHVEDLRIEAQFEIETAFEAQEKIKELRFLIRSFD